MLYTFGGYASESKNSIPSSGDLGKYIHTQCNPAFSLVSVFTTNKAGLFTCIKVNSSEANTPRNCCLTFSFDSYLRLHQFTFTLRAASIDKHEGNLAYNNRVAVSLRGELNFNSIRMCPFFKRGNISFLSDESKLNT